MSARMRKRHRCGSSSHLSSTEAIQIGSFPPPPSPSTAGGAAAAAPTSSVAPAPDTVLAPAAGGFNDPTSADVVLRLQLDPHPDDHPSSVVTPFLDLHLTSSALRRSRYFDALLSDRWRSAAPAPSSSIPAIASSPINLTLPVSSHSGRRPFDAHISVLRLLHTLDFASAIASVSDAIDMLLVALKLVFDDCIRACVHFLECVPWTEEEEVRILDLIPLLGGEENRDLVARVSPLPLRRSTRPSEAMLQELLGSVIHSHPNVANMKAFIANLLRDHPSRGSVQNVVDQKFSESLETVRELISKYASPDLRGAGDNDEREAIQRINLHSAAVNLKHLYWLIERMIELRMVGNAVRVWSEQATLTGDLQKTLKEEAWRNICPALPTIVCRCTVRLTGAVVSGNALAALWVRTKLVKHWLPVLIHCRSIVSSALNSRSIYKELEENFLHIISTLPVSDAQELLQQCLSFATRDVEECAHLVAAFKTWFRRADRQLQGAPPGPNTENGNR